MHGRPWNDARSNKDHKSLRVEKCVWVCFFFKQKTAYEIVRSRGLGDVYKRQHMKDRIQVMLQQTTMVQMDL